ncbi:MAG: transposase [Oscillospiraceae bacterium]|jgi:transposase|nr:transposase [Oscillospiraceae bacterium]
MTILSCLSAKWQSSLPLFLLSGVAPGNNQSGSYEQRSVTTSKKGLPHLRQTLFQIISTYLKQKPDNPVYYVLDRKRVEGKPFFVYMTATANKFLQR